MPLLELLEDELLEDELLEEELLEDELAEEDELLLDDELVLELLVELCLSVLPPHAPSNSAELQSNKLPTHRWLNRHVF